MALHPTSSGARRCVRAYEDVIDGFEDRVERHPGTAAVEFEGDELTYARLNRMADGLAGLLVERGVTAGQAVVICLEPGPLTAVAVLGVLKAGGAYVPVSPADPPNRIAFVVGDAMARVVLTEAAHAGRFAGVIAHPIVLDRLASLDGDRVPRTIDPQQAAFVLYTSGSSGRPKGVEITHRNLSYYLGWHLDDLRPALGDLDLPLSSSTCFAAGVTQFYTPLLLGRAQHVLRRDTMRQPDRVFDWYGGHPRYGLYCVPTLWNELLKFAERERDAGREVVGPRCVLLSGEAVDERLVERSVELWPALRLWNLYGPTEATANATAAELRPGRRTTIGAAIRGTRIYLADEQMRAAVPGATGEICICGPGVARGYLNLPALTRERFVANPFDPVDAERLFRTGDLARYDADGNLLYVGRRDFQVKIRGHRIECGDIEAALQAHPAVRQAVVVARENDAVERTLVGYVTFHLARYASVDDLREFLLAQVPDYMVPVAFVALDELPQLANGKVDRGRLPAPGAARPDLRYAFGAPASLREAQLVRIWEAALGLEGIGAHDDFFDLGGDSLKVAAAIARIRETLHVAPSYRAFFDHPTPAALAAVLDGEQAEPPGATALDPVPIMAVYPCAANQRSVWLLTQTFPDLTAYNMQFSLALEGELDEPAVARALGGVLERHQALRTVIGRDGARPVMRIAAPSAPALEVVDLATADRAGAGIEHELEWRCARERERPFDLERGPLLRATLYRLGAGRRQLTVTVHHLVFDGRSIDVFCRDLVEHYRAASGTGAGAGAGPAPIARGELQYRDWCAGRQAGAGAGAAHDELAEFWRGYLAGSQLVLDLPTDHVRPPVRSFAGGCTKVRVGRELKDAIVELSRDAQATPFMTLFTAFNVLLHRCSGQEDILVGCPVANREHSAAEDLVGFLANTIVLRTRLSSEQSFASLLDTTRTGCLEALDHQAIEFETLVGLLRPDRCLSRAPIFQVMFGYHERLFAGMVDDRLTAAARDEGTGGAKFDLVLDVLDLDDGWELRLTHATDLYAEDTVARWLDQYVRLLGAIVQSPARAVADYDLAGDDDLAQMRRWNETARANERRRGLHRLFEQQAARTPDRTALVDGGARTSYATLDARANQLAAHLTGLGVAGGDLVGVHLEASGDMVVAMLAILKAGAAYVALDPYYPPGRIADAVEDSGVGVIVTHAHLVKRLPLSRAQTVAIDADWPHIAAHPGAPGPARAVDPTALMYVMYTSGSTGRPKGVMVPHEGATNYVLWMRDEFPLSAADRVLSKTSINFDISVWEIFLPLVCGARLVVARREETQSPDALAELIRREQVTVVQFVPSALRAFVDSGRLPACDSLRRVFSGGEALPARLEQETLAASPAELHNLYGPTEASIYATHWACRRDERRHSVPIGRPIDNLTIHILDGRMRPVPINTTGDLYIGGVGVARGYLGAPDLTEAAFMPDPFSGAPGARLFRTNDRARFLRDGAIEFLGRSDRQVKVRGYRIELDEIAHRLNAHPQVRHAIIIVREDQADDVRLVAYLLFEEQAGPAPEELRSYLKQKLPDHMIPSAFVSLDSIPLLPNNKANIAALPKPEYTKRLRADLAREYADERERVLAEIWEEVLGTGRFGPEDSFFDVGGHSLLVARLGALIEQRLAVAVSNIVLFQFPTIRSLAAHLASRERTASGVAADMARRAALRNGRRRRPEPLLEER